MMKKSFSLIEIILAVTLFSLVAGSFIFLMIEAYRINERARDFTLATILAEEGIEAVRSIRDINFSELVSQTRSQCLAIENNRWVLKRISRRDCVELIGKFSRQVYITGSGNQKNVSVVVSWQPASGQRRDIKLFVRLTNWRR